MRVYWKEGKLAPYAILTTLHHRLINLGLDLLGHHATIRGSRACGLRCLSFWPRFTHAVCLVLATQRSFADPMENAGLVSAARLLHVFAQLFVYLFIGTVFSLGLGRGFVCVDGDLVTNYGKNLLSKTIDLAHLGRCLGFNNRCDFIIFPSAQK